MGFWNDACETAVSRSRELKIIASNTSAYVVVNVRLLLSIILLI